MTTCSAPELPPGFHEAQGWVWVPGRREGSWAHLDGRPVFFADEVEAFPPLKEWVEKMVAPKPLTLGDFDEQS